MEKTIQAVLHDNGNTILELINELKKSRKEKEDER